MTYFSTQIVCFHTMECISSSLSFLLVTLLELVVIFHTLSLSLLSHSPQKLCLSVHVLNMFLFSLGMMGTFAFLRVPRFVAGNFYRFKNEGYLLEFFKMRFFLTELFENLTFSFISFRFVHCSEVNFYNPIGKLMM